MKQQISRAVWRNFQQHVRRATRLLLQFESKQTRVVCMIALSCFSCIASFVSNDVQLIESAVALLQFSSFVITECYYRIRNKVCTFNFQFCQTRAQFQNLQFQTMFCLYGHYFNLHFCETKIWLEGHGAPLITQLALRPPFSRTRTQEAMHVDCSHHFEKPAAP